MRTEVKQVSDCHEASYTLVVVETPRISKKMVRSRQITCDVCKNPCHLKTVEIQVPATN